MAGDITIIIMSQPEVRKNLKSLMPKQVRESLDNVGVGVSMESGEELRGKLAPGFPNSFVVPEEVLVFPPEEDEPLPTKKRRRLMKDLNNKLSRKKQPGNTER